MTKRILLVDVSSVLHAVKHSGFKLLRHKDRPTYITFGFLMKLQQLMKMTKSDVAVFACDSLPEDSIRRKLYPPYKEKRRTREKTEKEIELDAISFPQFDAVIDDLLPGIGYSNIFKTKGLEADDIIGRICKTYTSCEIIIVTTDHDMYQLLTPKICVLNPKNMQYFTRRSFKLAYGIDPTIWKKVKAIGGCFDKKTEILTDRGWIYFNDLLYTDKVYSMNPVTRIAGYEKIKNIIKYEYNGEMYKIKGKLIDQLITPNHKYFGSTTQSYPTAKSKNVVRFKEMRDIIKYKNFTIPITSKWIGEYKSYFILPKFSHRIKNREGSYRKQEFPNVRIPMNPWLSFLGIWLADGHVTTNKNNLIGTIGISATKKRKLKYFQPILDSTPWTWHRNENGWRTDNRQLATYLHTLGKVKEKYIPREFLNLPITQLKLLFNSMMAGDGCVSNWEQNVFGKTLNVSSQTYYSSSKQLIDNFHELCIKLGYAASIFTHNPKEWHIKGKSGWSSKSYSASLLKSNNVNIMNGKNVTVVTFNDYVYDVETDPNHTIFVRRNNNSIWSSNCSSDEVKGVPGVAEQTALKYLKGELPSHYKSFQRIESEEGRRIINRNKPLVILPFRRTPNYDIQEDRISKLKLHTIATKYGFMSIVTDLEQWTMRLKGWA